MEKPAYQTLIEFWSTIDADINFGPTPPEAISALEGKYSIKLPPEFREYLFNVCPIGVDQVDSEMTTWWELDRIKSLKEESEGQLGYRIKDPIIQKDARFYIVFADFIFWGWAWAICCKPGENYGRILQMYETENYVSNSFGDFVQSYLKLWDKGMFLSSIE